MKTLKQLREDGVVAVNNVGQGNIAGTGIGPQGEPPGPNAVMLKKKQKVTDVLQRKKPSTQ
jgi:hypothetical protein